MYDNGNGVAIGTTSFAGQSLRIAKDITGSTNALGIYQTGQVQSDVTSAAFGFRNDANVASGFTLPSYRHIDIREGTISGTVTTQYGILINALSSAATNYGIYSNMSAAAANWNLYLTGDAKSYMAGDLGIGSTAPSGGPILTTTLTNGGSGYVDATYTDVAASAISATGNYALFTIVVSGGIVTTATLTWGGTAYTAGDTLTVSNTLLGGTGSGLIITVATVDSSKLVIRDATKPDITLYRNDAVSTTFDNLGSIKWESNDSTSKASGIWAELQAYSAGTSGGGGFKFYTRGATAGDTLSEKVVITSAGNLGVGITSPTSLLTVEGGANPYVIQNSGRAVYGIDVNATAGASGAFGGAISFGVGGTGRAAISGIQGTADSDVVGLGFFMHSSGTGSADAYEAVRITQSGNMGIGINAPTNKLHIDSGTATASYLQFTAGTTTGQTSTGGLSEIITVGVSQSSLIGDKSYGATAMLWSTLDQGALSLSYTKMNFVKGKLNSISSYSSTSAYLKGTLMQMVGYTWIKPNPKFGIYGVSAGVIGLFTQNDHDYTFTDSLSITNHTKKYTNKYIFTVGDTLYIATRGYNSNWATSIVAFWMHPPIIISPRMTVSPQVFIMGSPLSYNSITGVTTNKTIGAMLGDSWDYKLTKRFGVTAAHRVMIPATGKPLNFLLIGSRMIL